MRPFNPPRHALVLALLAAISLTACGGADDDGEQGTSTSEASTSSPGPSTSGGRDADASNGTSIRITFGETELTGRLRGDATARDLAAQLPLTLTFRDHNNAEKTAPLPREVAVDDAAAGHDPAAGDIGYWAPDSDLVLYYDNDAPYFDGIVRIGEFDGDLQTIRGLPDGSRVTLEHAE